MAAETELESIILAAGCFWGVELSFQRVPGVVETEVGYTQGYKKNPVSYSILLHYSFFF